MGKVAILYIGIGKYICFWKGFYVSMERFFLPDTEKHYFVFSDQDNIYAQDMENVHWYYQADLGWPYNSLYRFFFFNRIKEELLEFEYSFFMNANVYCNQIVKEREFLPLHEDFVFVLHHAFVHENSEQFPYERNIDSEAYIPFGMGKYYITGGVNGGKTEKFMEMSEELADWIQKDESKGIMAVWHDESFINKFLLQIGNYKILPPSFFYPELSGNMELNIGRKLVARDKRKYFDVAVIKENIELMLGVGGEEYLISEYYYHLCYKWLLLKSLGVSYINKFAKYRYIAIYSYNNLGKIIINDLETAGMQEIIYCILDAEPEKYAGRCRYPIFRPYELNEKIDLIVVAEGYHYSDILIDISMISDKEIVSIEDIITELLYQLDN